MLGIILEIMPFNKDALVTATRMMLWKDQLRCMLSANSDALTLTV